MPPVVGLRSRLWVNIVEHRFNSGDYSIELVPLGLGLLHQHIKLHLDPPMVLYRDYKDPSSQEITLAITPNTKYFTFQLLGQLLRAP